MLKSITLRNFKSFAGDPQTVPFAPVTVFVGTNGSGKSNAIDALRFLKGIGSDVPIEEVIEGHLGTADSEPGLRGGLADICWKGAAEFEIESRVVVTAKAPQAARSNGNGQEGAASRELVHSLRVRGGAAPEVRGEALSCETESDADERVFDRNVPATKEGVRTVEVEWRGNRIAVDFTVDVSRKSALLPLSIVPADAAPNSTDRRWFRALIDTYGLIDWHDFRPSAMRAYEHESYERLGHFGESLSPVLFRLARDAATKRSLLDWIAALCSPAIVDMQFEKTKHQSVLLELVENDTEDRDPAANRVVSAMSLSDGTLRFAAMLAAVFAAPRGAVLLFEEIENGLHPSRVHLLLEMFEQLAEHRGIQIVATTHSPQALLALSEQARRDVVLFHRSGEKPGSLATRLGDLPHFDDVMASGRIDELFAEGWMEFAAP